MECAALVSGASSGDCTQTLLNTMDSKVICLISSPPMAGGLQAHYIHSDAASLAVICSYLLNVALLKAVAAYIPSFHILVSQCLPLSLMSTVLFA